MNGMDPEERDCANNDAFCGWVNTTNKLTRLACIPKTLNYEDLPIELKDECVKDLENNVATCLCAVDNCNYQCNISNLQWLHNRNQSFIFTIGVATYQFAYAVNRYIW